MITPFDRYRWLRLPFELLTIELKVSSDIFQRKLNDAIVDLPGVFAVADDVIVVGRGETDSIAVLHHNANLRLYERCERHIILNDEKNEISFIRHQITKDGIRSDPNKVTAIREMLSPTDIHGVKRFGGMVQYSARFVPNLARLLESLEL